MGKKRASKLQEKTSLSRELKSLELKEKKKDPLIVLSFRNLDRNQGQSFEDWEEDKLLALALNKLREVCELTVKEATSKQIIKCYATSPPKSKFEHPKHVLPDVQWCSMHIQGKECVIGYFEDNIFHIVFLDKNHEFWITEKKNT